MKLFSVSVSPLEEVTHIQADLHHDLEVLASGEALEQCAAVIAFRDREAWLRIVMYRTERLPRAVELVHAFEAVQDLLHRLHAASLWAPPPGRSIRAKESSVSASMSECSCHVAHTRWSCSTASESRRSKRMTMHSGMLGYNWCGAIML